jgi:hypothetical protein
MKYESAKKQRKSVPSLRRRKDIDGNSEQSISLGENDQGPEHQESDSKEVKPGGFRKSRAERDGLMFLPV